MANRETNNFKAALNELLSGKISTTEENAPPLFKEEPKQLAVEETIINQYEEYEKVDTEDETELVETFQPEKEVEEFLAFEEIPSNIYVAPVAPVAPTSYETAPQVTVSAMQQVVENKIVGNETVIAHDVIIEGNIKSSSKLRIVGEVTGDVKSTADVVIEGKVGGSIQGNNIYLSECEVNNSITASNEVSISERSMVNGDVKAGAIVSNGVINGNIDAQSVSLNSASRTVGNVKCKLIKIGEGAGLKGALETID